MEPHSAEVFYSVEFSRLYFKLLNTSIVDSDYFKLKSLLDAEGRPPPNSDRPVKAGDVVKVHTALTDYYIGVVLGVSGVSKATVRSFENKNTFEVNIEAQPQLPKEFPKIQQHNVFQGVRQQLHRLRHHIQEYVVKNDLGDFGGERIEVSKSFEGMAYIVGTGGESLESRKVDAAAAGQHQHGGQYTAACDAGSTSVYSNIHSHGGTSFQFERSSRTNSAGAATGQPQWTPSTGPSVCAVSDRSTGH